MTLAVPCSRWRRKLTSNAGPTALVPLAPKAPGGLGLRNGTAARTLTQARRDSVTTKLKLRGKGEERRKTFQCLLLGTLAHKLGPVLWGPFGMRAARGLVATG